jgi:phage repressor protein C with HTH and peptisase S24 domain
MALGANIKRLRLERGWDQPTLSERSGVDVGTISALEVRDSERSKYAPQLATALGVSVGELYGTAGEIGSPPAGSEHMARVPVVGDVQAGADGYLEEYGYPVGHGSHYVVHRTTDRNAYGVRVRGDSMRPRIKRGEVIVVEPARPYEAGDDVIVKLKDGRKMVKEFLYRRDGEITLKSVNQDFQNITISVEDVEAVHAVAAIYPRGSGFVEDAD